MKVSVVVPVYNPGPNLRFCLDALRAQTMPASDFEVVLVDDGSTDGTADALDALAQTDPEFFRVIHIPNSGWPGRPRNVGIAAARGDYVQLVDNDDELAPHALEALVALGEETAADVVIGKMASDFRGLNHPVFRETQRARTLADFPFEETLTPHKMFRREFLDEHGLRFPEGPRHLEDQLFVMQAYVRARSISLLSGRPCYFYQRRRGVGRNAGDIYMDPSGYYANLAEVLDVAATIPAGEVRHRVFRRFFRVEILSRISGVAMVEYDDDYRRDLVTQARQQAQRWLTPKIAEGLPTASRLQLRLLLANDIDGLVALSAAHARIALHATIDAPQWRDGVLHVEVEAELLDGEQPLVAEPGNGQFLAPTALSFGASDAERTLDDPATAELEMSLISRFTNGSIALPADLRLSIDDNVIRVRGSATVDPRTAGGGEPLAAGVWDLRLRLRYAGWSRIAALAARGELSPPPVGIVADAPPVIPYWTQPKPALALDVGEWTHPLVAELLRDAPPESASLDGDVLRLRLPAYTAPDVVGSFVVLLEGARVVAVPATLRAGVVEAQLPRRGLSAGRWNLWLRGEQAGAAAAQSLGRAVEIAADGRGMLLV